MNKLLFVLTIIFLSGCITAEKCAERFPPATSVKDSVHVRDSVIITYVPYLIPKDSVVFHDSVPCGDFYLDVEKKHNNITASLHIEAGKVTFKCLEDSLRAMLEQRDRTIAEYQGSKKTEVTDNAANNEHWYDPFCRWFTLIAIVCIVIYLGWKIKGIMPIIIITVLAYSCQTKEYVEVKENVIDSLNIKMSPPRPPKKPCCWPPPCVCDTVKK